MSDRFCTECGHPLSENANYCPGCGRKITRQESSRPVKTQGADTSPVEEYNSESAVQQSENAGFNAAGKTKRKSALPKKSRKIIIISICAVLLLAGILLTLILNRESIFNSSDEDLEKTLYAPELYDWTSYPDLGKEQKAIEKRQKNLIENLEKGNIDKAVANLYPEIQDTWKTLFENDPEGAAALAEVLSGAEMAFLGTENNAEDDPRSRTATYIVEYEGYAYYVTWIKQGKTWYLYEF